LARLSRIYVSNELGSYHIISRVVGKQFLLKDEEKEHYLSLLERLSQAFFIQVHTFCLMDNHIHLHVSGLDAQANEARDDELLARYKLIYGPDAMPPMGSTDSNGDEIADPDYGMQRLRARLGSVSRFMQELQQTFSRWYNKRHERIGYFWASRFKSVLVSKDESQLICSSYIDLNPIRAGIVEKPEDYRWCALGLIARNPNRAKRFMVPIPMLEEKGHSAWDWYRLFVYFSGSLEKPGSASISPNELSKITELQGRLNLSTRLRYRVSNLSEGLAIGTQSFIESIQKDLNRKFIRARECLDEPLLYSTRCLVNEGT
jgi:putative transposase